jgi:hypothetical protein
LAEKKFSGCTVPSAAVGKAVADGFYVFADGFGHSAKELFPVVRAYAVAKLVLADLLQPTYVISICCHK